MRLVLDTNVVLDLVVFEDPGVRPLRAAIERGEAVLLCCDACHAELRRVLAYRIRRRPNQTVTFYDTTAAGASRRIGVVTGGGNGKLTFRPSPGRSTHAIAARFALDGVPAENLTVAHFKPPSPVLPKPRALRSRHKGSRLLVSWRRVGGAKRYDRVRPLPRGWACGLAHGKTRRLFSCGKGGTSGDLRKWPHALVAIRVRS